jgi:thiosulfate/3-mercaptopyruvate sulfurtransferase
MRRSDRVRCAVRAVSRVALGVSLALVAPAVAGPEPVKGVPLVGGGVWANGDTIIAGQPTEAGMRELARRGITAVISVRSVREMADAASVPFDEPALVRELGMDYIHLPLNGTFSYRPELVDRIAEIMAEHKGKVALHCASGWRASLVWAAYRTRHGGLPFDDAMAEAESMAITASQMENLLGQRIRLVPTGEPLEREPSWLVSADWLAENLDDDGLAILDVRPNYIQYFTSHVAGAAHMDAHSLRGPAGGLPVQYRTPERMGEIFAQAGVSARDSKVIAYADGADILSATMTLYALERMGYTNTGILDGGLVAAGARGIVSQAYPAYEAGELSPIDNTRCRATLADVEAGLASRRVTFIDARPTDQYEGTTVIWQRNGHIPGAVNVWWKSLTTDANTHALKPRAEIEKLFADAGVTPDQDIIVYCGTSREATLIYLYLTRELSFPNVRLFEGAWTEYSASTLPMETGPRK